MRNNRFILWISVICVVILTVVAVNSQTNKTKSKAKTTKVAATAPTPAPEPPIIGPDTKEGVSQASKSAKVLTEIMGIPDKGIPRDLLDRAECVLVFPNVIKAGFIVGGQGGRGA